MSGAAVQLEEEALALPALGRASAAMSGPPTIGALGASVMMETVQNMMRQHDQLVSESLDGPPTLSGLESIEGTALDEPVTLSAVENLQGIDGPPSVGSLSNFAPGKSDSPAVGLRTLPQQQGVQSQDMQPQPQQSSPPQLQKDMLRPLQPSPGPPTRQADAASHIGHSVSAPVPVTNPRPEYPPAPPKDTHHTSPAPIQRAPGRPSSNTVAVSVQPALVIPTTAVVVPVQAAPTAPSSSPPPAAPPAWEHMGLSQSSASTKHLPVPLGLRPNSGLKRQASTSLKAGSSDLKRGRGRPPGRTEGALRPPDGDLAPRVRAFMKEMKLSQQVVSKESNVSQAVISQWLASKYNGDNTKIDSLMRSWLQKRNGEGGQELVVLPSSRSQLTAKRKRAHSGGPVLAGAGVSTRVNMRVCSVLHGDQTVASTPGSADLCTTPRAAENRFNEMLEKLTAYKLEHGHCRVPRIYPADRALGRWVNNIRSGNTRTEKHGRGGHGPTVQPEDGTTTGVMAGVIGHARLNELGFCWHAKNSYIHAQRSRLYDMNNAARLLHPDTVKEIAAAMGKMPTLDKPLSLLTIREDLEKGIKAHSGQTALPFSHRLASHRDDSHGGAIAPISMDCIASATDVLDGWFLAGGDSQASTPSSEAPAIAQAGRPLEYPPPPPMAGQLHLQPAPSCPPAVTPPIPPTPRLEDRDNYSPFQLSVPIGRPAQAPRPAQSELHVHPDSSQHVASHPRSLSIMPSSSVRHCLQRLCSLSSVHCLCSIHLYGCCGVMLQMF